jgi:hypothetical protein
MNTLKNRSSSCDPRLQSTTVTRQGSGDEEVEPSVGDTKTAMNGGMAGEEGPSVGGGKGQGEVLIDSRKDSPPKRGLGTNEELQVMATKAARFNH